MTSGAVKDSKAKILEAFQQILMERQARESNVATKEEEAEKAQNQQILETASHYTSDSIVRGLADLQIEFGSIITNLSGRLSSETTKLDELKRAIAFETQHFQELQQTRVVADALYILTQEHQEKLKDLEQQASRDRETLEKEITEAQKSWQQEQEEFAAAQTESQELLTRERQRQEEDYQYETERSRTIATDDYEAKKRQIERELQETAQAKEKDWLERERILQANQTQLETYHQKAESFPTELEESIKRAREEGIREVNQDAKVKADLFEKEWEATKQSYELQIQSLEAKIQKQTEQITEISNQLQAAMRQAQDLAMRAFESSSNRITA
jgi:hypothetical protein